MFSLLQFPHNKQYSMVQVMYKKNLAHFVILIWPNVYFIHRNTAGIVIAVLVVIIVVVGLGCLGMKYYQQQQRKSRQSGHVVSVTHTNGSGKAALYFHEPLRFLQGRHLNCT